MRIGIDGRPLQEHNPGGVQVYTRELITALTEHAPQHDWRVFFNSFSDTQFEANNFQDNQVVKKGIPNKLLNTSLLLSNQPHLNKWTNSEVWISPNLNFTALSPNVKHIQVVHDLSFLINPSWFSIKSQLWHRTLNIKKLFERADILVAISEQTKTDLISYFPQHKNKIHVIYPGAPQQHHLDPALAVKIKTELNLPPQFFLYLGALSKRKNIRFLLDSFAHFNKTTATDHKLIVAGPGSLPKGSHKNVRHLGAVNEQQKQALLSLAQTLVFPSLYEGFGFPPLEAMQHGTPVITSSSSSLPEVVGKAGILVNPYKPHELSSAMRLISSNQELRAQLAREGFQQTKKFAWNRTAEEFMKIIGNHYRDPETSSG